MNRCIMLGDVSMCGAHLGKKSVCCTFRRRNPEFGQGEENEINCVNMVNSTVNKRTYHIESSFLHVNTCFL